MSEHKEKTFKVTCAVCERPFLIRFPLAQSDAEGEGEVVVTCQFCEKKVKIKIPQKYIGKDTLLRSVPA
jgi:hypothetical protein